MKKFERHFYTEGEKKGYDRYINAFNLPLKLQKFLHYKNKLPGHISYIDVVEKDETISMIYNKASIGMGSKSIYKKIREKIAFTYYKKGRSNARIKIWSNGKANDMWLLMTQLTKYLNIDISWFEQKDLGVEAIKHCMTKGMWSMIICNKIKSNDDLVKYWIKYSLRMKIDEKYVNEIKTLLSTFHTHNTRRILYTSHNPNSFLESISNKAYKHTPWSPPVIDYDQIEMLCDNLMALDVKVDWSSTKEQFYEIERKTILEIDKGLRLFEMWDKGQDIGKNALSDLPF